MQSKAKILIVESDASVRDTLSDYLTKNGLNVAIADNQEQALYVIKTGKPNLAVIDTGLTGGDGLSLFRKMRLFSDIPAIFLSKDAEDTDRIIGLEIGADDYMSKPCNPRELFVRIKAILRRLQPQEGKKSASKVGTKIYFGNCSFDLSTYELKNARGETTSLSGGERKILMILLNHPNQVLSRDKLLNITQSNQSESFDRSVDNLISRLRKKLEINPKSPKLIKTHWGGGYALSVDVIRK